MGGASISTSSSITSVNWSEEEVELEFCKPEDQIADIFTKPLKAEAFYKLKLKMGIYSSLVV